MSANPPTRTVHLIGLTPAEARLARGAFLARPAPGWQAAVMEVGAPLPGCVQAGKAVLAVRCGRPGLFRHAEAGWLLRALAAGCPWVAVGMDDEAGEAAGAAAAVPDPFPAGDFRDLVWQVAVPLVGRTTLHPLTPARALGQLAAVRATALVRLTGPDGRAAVVGVRDGRPVHATADGHPGGPAALRAVLDWGRGRLHVDPLPADLPVNLTDSPAGLPRPADTAADGLPGGTQACDAAVAGIPGLTGCALVDLRTGRVAAWPSAGPPADPGFVGPAAELLRDRFRPAAGGEVGAEEVIALGRDGWCAAARLGAGPLALVVAADGLANLGLAQMAFAAAAAELERGVEVMPATRKATEPEPAAVAG